MAVNFLPDYQYPAPPAADGTTLVLPAAYWTYTAYATLIAATDADDILTGVVVRAVGTITVGYAFEVDIAVGAPGSEVVIATVRGMLIEVTAAVGSEGLYFPTGIGIDAIPSGSRVSTRMRAGIDLAHNYRISISYLKKPLTGTLLTTPNLLRCYPSGTDNFSISVPVDVATPWVTGAVVQLFDATGPSRIVVGCVAIIFEASTEWEFDLCIGVGNTVVTTRKGTGSGVSSHPNYLAFPHPLVLPALTKVSVQARSEDIGTILRFAISYLEAPL